MTPDEASILLKETANKVGEHFDAVLIIGSWQEGDSSHFSSSGSGNYYLRTGMAHQFIQSAKSQTAAEHIAREITPPDEGETWKQ